MKILKSAFIIFCFFSVKYFSGCGNEDIQTNSSPRADYTQIDFEPSLSNDNQKLIYAHSDIDFELTGIYLYNFTTKADSLIINAQANCPDWSPDEKWIVFSLNNLLVKIKSDGDSQTVISGTGKNFYPKWCDDGSKIAYSDMDCGISGNCGVYVINSSGDDKTLIESGCNFPDWTDSGSTLIYFKPLKDGSGNHNGDSLIKYSLINNTRLGITEFSGDDHTINSYINFSGNEVFFCSTSKTGYSYIYKYNISQHSLIKLTISQGWSPEISFYSDKIIYTNRNPGNGRLWIMNKDGSNPHHLNY